MDWDLYFRIAGVSYLGIAALIVVRDSAKIGVGLTGALFFFSVASHLLGPLLYAESPPTIYMLPIVIGDVSAPLYFWLFSRALFKSSFKIRPWHVGLVLTYCVYSYVVGYKFYGQSIEPTRYEVLSSIGAAVSLGFAILALVQAYAGRRHDVVEKRRRLREIFVTITGGYIFLVALVEVFLRGAATPASLVLLDAGSVFVITIAIALYLFKLNLSALALDTKSQSKQPSILDPIDKPMLKQLMSAIEEKKIYRREGLTITQLAEVLTVQEYRLRRLINQGMGYRNFNDFLNSYRVAEAKEKLSDLEHQRLPVLTIAMDLGYRYLGPFNRVFREETGMTPTEFRKSKLADPVSKTPAP